MERPPVTQINKGKCPGDMMSMMRRGKKRLSPDHMSLKGGGAFREVGLMECTSDVGARGD